MVFEVDFAIKFETKRLGQKREQGARFQWIFKTETIVGFIYLKNKSAVGNFNGSLSLLTN